MSVRHHLTTNSRNQFMREFRRALARMGVRHG